MITDEPITFTEPSYALIDTDVNQVCTTNLGNLAIFTVRGIAEAAVKLTGKKNIAVVPVLIHRIMEH